MDSMYGHIGLHVTLAAAVKLHDAPTYDAACLRDPDGHHVEAVCLGAA